MKYILLFTFTMMMGHGLTAQDSIFLRKNRVQLGKVTEVYKNTISYKKSANPDGPDYKFNTADVDSIVYENGMVDRFKRKIGPPGPHNREPVYMDDKYVSPRVANIIKNKQRFPRTLPHNLVSAGYYMHDISGQYHNDLDDKLKHGVYVQYERLVLNEVVGINAGTFVAFNQKQYGLKAGIKAYTKFFGQLRIGVGANYAISKQHFVHGYGSIQDQNSWWQTVSVKDNHATMGAVHFASTAMLHLTPQYLLALNAEVGGIVHTSKPKNIPASWRRDNNTSETVGMVSIGFVRRF